MAKSTSMARQTSHGSDRGSGDWPLDAPPPLALPLTFVVTPAEAHHLRTLASKVGLAKPPPPVYSSAASTNPPTPTASYPSTPTSGSGYRGSPFVAAFTAAFEEKDKTKDSKTEEPPKLSVALDNALQDDVLPLASRAAIRSFLAGYIISTLLESLLPGLLRRKTPREALRSIFSQTSTRIGAGFGLFTLLYRSLTYFLNFLRLKSLASLPALAPSSLPSAAFRSRVLARLVRLLRGEGVAPSIAALLASPALVLLPSQTPSRPGAPTFPRKSLALDLFTKGLHNHYHLLRRSGSRATSWVPKWCDSALLYAIGNGQLLWAFLFEPYAFPKGYGDIILARSSAYIPSRPENFPSSIPWPSKRQIADHVALLSTPTRTASAFPSFTSPSLSALHPSPYPTTSYKEINPVLDFSPAHPAHTELLCALLHPTEPSCRKNLLDFWKREWIASARFVGAFLAAFNVLRWKAWLKDPEKQLFGFSLSVAQGATVISGSIGTAWALTCFFQHYLPRTLFPRFRYFLNGFFSSIFIFAVPPSRRSQLGLYVGRMSLDSTYQVLVQKRKLRPIPKGDVMLLAIGISLLANLYEGAPGALGKGLRRILGLFLLGNRQAGSSVSRAGLPLLPPSDQAPAGSTASEVTSSNFLPSAPPKGRRKARFDV